MSKTAQHHHKGQTNTTGMEERLAQKTAPANTAVNDGEQFRLTQVRAYVLWEQAGRPNDDGSRERFWHEAEQEITAR